MKRKWTYESAMNAVVRGGARVVPGGIALLKQKGLNGLKACSAYDYLTMHCNVTAYRIVGENAHLL